MPLPLSSGFAQSARSFNLAGRQIRCEDSEAVKLVLQIALGVALGAGLVLQRYLDRKVNAFGQSICDQHHLTLSECAAFIQKAKFTSASAGPQ
jgi:hypothetical protein